MPVATRASASWRWTARPRPRRPSRVSTTARSTAGGSRSMKQGSGSIEVAAWVVGAWAVSAAGILVAVAVLDGGGRVECGDMERDTAKLAELDADQPRPTDIGED